MPMNPEVKAKWLEALRSGEYKQGHAVLKETSQNETCFCCLGVLCDISKLGNWDDPGYVVNEDWEASFLPSRVRTWAGLQTELRCTDIPSIDIRQDDIPALDSPENMLTVMNDGGSTFSEIADWIEQNL